MNTKNTLRAHRVAVAGVLLGLLGCGASGPTQELVDARRQYQYAQRGPAPRLAPEALYQAEKALKRAEAAHKDDPGSIEERDLAYIAHRKVELAEAKARIKAQQNEQKSAENRYQENLEAAATNQSGELKQTQAQLASEQKARQEAERQSQAAMASLKELGNVREDSRGTVLTLSGAVLFKTGESTLLPIAREKLHDVAEVIKQSGDKVVIEGHTDSRGATARNQQLSQARADAVRSFLTEEGVSPDQVAAVGKGESEPIAENSTAEGRADNRRVEIVMQPSTSRQASISNP